MEEESASTLKEAKKRVNDIAKTVLRDPIDYLLNLDKDVLNVDDLVSALSVSHEEVNLIAEMTTGQWENPLWMDARQWRSQPAILDRFVIGNAKEVTHHHSTSTFLGVYGYPVSPAISWGIQHESDAINMLESIKKVHVEPCGICISEQYPFLGASPDGIVHGEDSGAKLVEVKCPFKHRDKTIEEACHDPMFCIELRDGVFQLKRHHHYYYQVTGQLGITGISAGYFVIWTQADIFIKEIVLDKDVWSTMQDT
jgi:hypothetical protein